MLKRIIQIKVIGPFKKKKTQDVINQPQPKPTSTNKYALYILKTSFSD